MTQQVIWLFGRGLSIGCGLTWDVPEEWQAIPRPEKVEKIRLTLAAEMDSPSVSIRSIREFHLFLTTNWDFLLQREVLSFLPDEFVPVWLSTSHVFHINGTVEKLTDQPLRSPFLLTEDPESQRTNSVEANTAFGKMIWETTFVVVGMSFECATDKFLLYHLNRVEDDLPIGESRWIIVNPDPGTLAAASARIEAALPLSNSLPCS
jgi:hypothetical protein